MISLLGKVSDAEVGRRYGISINRVRTKRHALGIAAHLDKRAVVRKPALIKLLQLPTTVIRQRTELKHDTIAQLRQEYGIKPLTISEFRWPPEVIARLGTLPDAEIARERRITQNRVSAKQRSLGILLPKHSWRRWMPNELALVGTLSDQEVAARIRRSLASVRTKRHQLARSGRAPRNNPR